MIIKKIKAFQRKKGGGENYGVGFKKKKKRTFWFYFIIQIIDVKRLFGHNI